MRQSGVSLDGFLCSLFCDRAAGLLSVELSIVMFSGSCMFSQTLMLKHSQVVTSGRRLREEGEESCPVATHREFLSLSSTVAVTVSTTPALSYWEKVLVVR